MAASNQQIGQGGYGRILAISQDEVVKVSTNTQPYLPTTETINEATITQLVKSPYVLSANSVEVLEDETMITFPRGLADLHNYIKSGIRINNLDKKLILYRIALGIAALHNSGVVHRDLKPPNILLFRDSSTKEYIPRIADFGSSDASCDGQDKVGAATYLSASPETLLYDISSPKSDVWSFGVIMVNLLSDRQIFYYTNHDDPHSKDAIIRTIKTRLGEKLGPAYASIQAFPDARKIESWLQDAVPDTSARHLCLNIFLPENLRPTIFQVLSDPYFSAYRGSSPPPLELSCQEIKDLYVVPSDDVLIRWNNPRNRLDFILDLFPQTLGKSANVFLTAIDILDKYVEEDWFNNLESYTLLVYIYAAALYDYTVPVLEGLEDVLRDFNQTTNLIFPYTNFLHDGGFILTRGTNQTNALLAVASSPDYPTWNASQRLNYYQTTLGYLEYDQISSLVPIDF